ncbi:MAG: BatA domain-containing protein, partial [Rubripirellula sp.]
MSFLAPLYALGILAIAGPIILHLIRRQPNENLPFSSLLFLNPTPPRLTKRSRINDWLLLILRAMVILAMALAFARPYLRDSEKKTVTEPGRRVVIMVDTSASMNRQDLWQGALSAIEETLQQLQPQDEVALLSFDETPTLHVDFNHESRLQAAQQQQLILNAAKSLQPTARRTELGDALQFAAEFSVNGSEPSETDDTDMTIGDIATGNDTSPSSPSEQGSMQIVLISDMQTGGNLRSLQSYPWPKSVSVNLKSLQSSSASNATVSIMPSSDEDQRKEQRRLRVENANTSAKADFRLSWVANEKILPGSQNIQVPAGQTRVISMPQPSQD